MTTHLARFGAVAVLLALLAGCGPAAAKHKAHHGAAPKAMTAAEGTAICSDVATWLPKAENEGYPRFTPKLTADTVRALAGRAKLGLDLEGLGSDLLSENAVALVNGPPGEPSNLQLVRSDCSSYGVTVPGT